MAAGRTVGAGRKLHSLHAYFLRPGAHGALIDLEVARIRDGGSFSTRRVTVGQRGEAILEMTASFALDEAGLSQQAVEMPEVPGPAGLKDRERLRSQRYREVLGIEQRPYESAVEVRLCDPSVVEPGRSSEPVQSNWLRVKGALPDDPLLQRAFLVYASDRTLLSTARLPYDLGRHRLMSVSLDHAMWIHRDVSMSDWHLCHCSAPASENGRSILLCHLYRQDGVCVATVAQEGLVRVRRPRHDPP
jgi:acyl-CoA thioesterase-2